LRRVFEGVVAKCIVAGLVGGEALSVDASLIKADVDKKKRMPGDQPIAWPKPEEASRAVREYLTALDNARADEESDGSDGDNGGIRRKPVKEVSLTDPRQRGLRGRVSIRFLLTTPIISLTTRPGSSSTPKAHGPTG
jgi:hypothetical protein